MIRQVAEPLRRRSWVGIASSLTMHALFLAAVWVLMETSPIEDSGGAEVRIVGLVPGEREAPVLPKPAGPRVARRAVMAKPTVPRVVAPPTAQPSEPAPVPAPPTSAVPPTEPVVSPPEPVAPPAEIASEPVVAAANAAQASGGPLVEPTESVAEARGEPPAVADGSLPAGPEDARPLPLTVSVPPELARLQEVTADATISARAKAEPFLARREVFEFLLDHLEFATHVTRALRVARYRAWRTPDGGLVLDDGWGSLMNLALVQATSGARVVYARGQYRQRLLPDINGEAVVMIEYDMTPAGDGRDLVSAAVTSYVKIESGFTSFLVKLASAAVTDKAELESRRLVRVFARVSRAIEENPARVYDEVRRQHDVPQLELEEFRRLLRLP